VLIALHFGANCGAICCKLHLFCRELPSILHNNAFLYGKSACLILQANANFQLPKTSARIEYLPPNGQLVNGEGTLDVKKYTKNFTPVPKKQDVFNNKQGKDKHKAFRVMQYKS